MKVSMSVSKMKHASPAASLSPILLLVFSATLLTAACASTDEDVANAKVASNGEKLVCRKQELTGTRFAKSDCATQEFWDSFDKKSRENTDEYARQSKEAASVNRGGATTDGSGGRVMGPTN